MTEETRALPPEIATKEAELRTFLEGLDIPYSLYRHAPAFTVTEAAQLRGDIPGGHAKCLFIRDKKRRRALVIAEESTPLDLNQLAIQLDMGRLSFASATSLKTYLDITPGSVTPFALWSVQNPPDSVQSFQLVLDSELMKHEQLNFHPLHNMATMGINRNDLLKFITACGYDCQLLKLAKLEPTQ